MPVTARAASQESQRGTLTPRAGGVIPRPRSRSTKGAARMSSAAAASDHQRRGLPRRHSRPAANNSSAASTVSDPADELNMPSMGR